MCQSIFVIITITIGEREIIFGPSFRWRYTKHSMWWKTAEFGCFDSLSQPNLSAAVILRRLKTDKPPSSHKPLTDLLLRGKNYIMFTPLWNTTRTRMMQEFIIASSGYFPYLLQMYLNLYHITDVSSWLCAFLLVKCIYLKPLTCRFLEGSDGLLESSLCLSVGSGSNLGV